MKKVISLFLTLAMLLSIVSVVDFSAFADVQTGKCGENVTYSIDTETGELTISGKGTMANYSLNNSPFYHNSDIKTITISSGVTSIGNVVFKYCTSLTSITLPDGVTSIGDDAFYNCTRLTSITIPDSVTSIGGGAFSYCKNLTSVTIPNSVTRIGDYAFYLCTSLEDVYYLGTKAEWNSIYIKDDNDCLINATLHFIDDVNPQPTPQPNPQPNPQPSVPVPQPQPTPQPSVPVTQPQQTTQPMTVPTVTTTQDSTTTKTAVALPSGCTVVGGEYISSKLKKPTIKKVTKGKKKVTVQWKKVSGVSGYEIQVATDKKFKKNKKTVTIKKQKTTKTTVKKLKAKKKYFVRVRTYKTVNGKKVYSSWSKVKTVKTK